MLRPLSIVLAVLALTTMACSSTTTGGGGTGTGQCGNIAGTWRLSGGCGSDTCIIVQSTCDTDFKCGGGSVSYKGSISGDKVSYAGKTATGIDGTCNGTLNGITIKGTCTSSAGTCDVTATKQ